MAITLQQLRSNAEKASVVEFRPWLVGDRDQLLAELFDSLATAVANIEYRGGDATRKTKIAAQDVAEKLRSYAKHLGPVGKLTGLAGAVVPGLSVLGPILEKVGEVSSSEPKGPPLSVRKDELAAALKGLNHRIIVAVDDVDRLEPAEVRELLRLVRSVADFPNVAYLLCYDGTTLARSIETAIGVRDGRAFLEKIIQTEIGVPRPESFALRRLFSTELALFTECGASVGQRLMQVIDTTGGRCFDTPRTVTRILDSLRLIWPSLEGRVDLADLVWLRIIAVANPHLYRWTEEYLDALAVLASGRGSIDPSERTQVGKRLDEALEADGTEWDRMVAELDLVIPRLGYGKGDIKQGDERVFAMDRSHRERASQDRRLGSPDHSRIYFALAKSKGSVDVADIEALLSSSRESASAASELLESMAEESSSSGATKAERMLDHLRYTSPDRLLNSDLRNLASAIASVAAKLGSEHIEEWGHPRSWALARNAIGALRAPAGAEWKNLLVELFSRAPYLDFLVYLLRVETQDHGLSGEQARSYNLITSIDEYGAMRDSFIPRLRNLGIDGIVLQRRSASMLFAWSQAGYRDEVVAAVLKFAGDDVGRLAYVGRSLIGRSRDSNGEEASIDPKGLEAIFDDVPSVLESFGEAASAGDQNAIEVLSAVNSALSFYGGTIDGWITLERERRAANKSVA